MIKNYSKICVFGLAIFMGQVFGQSLKTKSQLISPTEFLKLSSVCISGIPPYDNTEITENGTTSQIFEQSHSVYTSEAADDFEVPDGAKSICNVKIVGVNGNFSGDPDSKIILNLYINSGDLPGTLVFSEEFYSANVVQSNGLISLPIASLHNLNSGSKYWIGIQAKLNYEGGQQWYWANSPTQKGESFAWRNPGDGFNTGCTNWATASNCINISGPDQNMLIEFSGTLGAVNLDKTKSMVIYPNPATDFVNLTTVNGLKILSASAIDISGKIYSIKLNNDTLDIRNLAKGNYILKIETNYGIATEKLIKK